MRIVDARENIPGGLSCGLDLAYLLLLRVCASSTFPPRSRGSMHTRFTHTVPLTLKLPPIFVHSTRAIVTPRLI